MACCVGGGAGRGFPVPRCHGDPGPLFPQTSRPPVLHPGPESWARGAVAEKVGQAPLGPGKAQARVPRPEKGGNPRVKGHPPPGAGCHPCSVSLVSPTSWQGRARGDWLPPVCVRSGFDRDSWCHKLPCLIWLPRDGRQQPRDCVWGGLRPQGLERTRGEQLLAPWVPHSWAGAFASVRRCVCNWCAHRSRERPVRGVSAYVCQQG